MEQFHRAENVQIVLYYQSGEPGGIRTHDPMIKSHVLYRLSYGLTCVASMVYANAACVQSISDPSKNSFEACAGGLQ